jgi:hypothetical protein
MARTPIFDKLWSQTDVCVWDVAAAHLLYEEALHRNPEESAGQAFLVSGNGPAWRVGDIRNAVRVSVLYCTQLAQFGADVLYSTIPLVLLSSTKYQPCSYTSSRTLWSSFCLSVTVHYPRFMRSAAPNLASIHDGWASSSIYSQ